MSSPQSSKKSTRSGLFRAISSVTGQHGMLGLLVTKPLTRRLVHYQPVVAGLLDGGPKPGKINKLLNETADPQPVAPHGSDRAADPPPPQPRRRRPRMGARAATPATPRRTGTAFARGRRRRR